MKTKKNRDGGYVRVEDEYTEGSDYQMTYGIRGADIRKMGQIINRGNLLTRTTTDSLQYVRLSLSYEDTMRNDTSKI